MKFGIALETFTPPGRNPQVNEIYQNAEIAESLGFDSVWAWDHILLGSRKVFPVLDCLSTLASIGARTKKLKLGTSVLVMALRNPVVLAKVVSTIQYLTEGRLLLGVASGWYKREFEAMGVSFEKRGKIFEERFNMLRQLLEQDEVNYEKDGYVLSHASMQPKPSTKVPLLSGGYSDSVLERAGKISDGWIGYYYNPEDFKHAVMKVASFAKAAGRNENSLRWVNIVPLAIEKSFEEGDRIVKDFTQKYMDLPKNTACTPDSGVRGTIDQCLEQVKSFARAGAHDLVFIPCFYDKKYIETAGKELIPALQGQ